MNADICICYKESDPYVGTKLKLFKRSISYHYLMYPLNVSISKIMSSILAFLDCSCVEMIDCHNESEGGGCVVSTYCWFFNALNC